MHLSEKEIFQSELPLVSFPFRSRYFGSFRAFFPPHLHRIFHCFRPNYVFSETIRTSGRRLHPSKVAFVSEKANQTGGSLPNRTFGNDYCMHSGRRRGNNRPRPYNPHRFSSLFSVRPLLTSLSSTVLPRRHHHISLYCEGLAPVIFQVYPHVDPKFNDAIIVESLGERSVTGIRNWVE